MTRYLLIAFAALFIASPVEAKYKSPAIDVAAIPAYPIDHQARTPGARQRAASHGVKATQEAQYSQEPYSTRQRASNEESYLPHPTGCPSRAFCACGASVEAFGHAIRDLWPASAWYRFPRTSPAPDAVAVKPHHVFVLRSHIEGSIWLVADYNSGGHQSRLHARSIAGYTIVDPHGSQMAHIIHNRHRTRYARR